MLQPFIDTASECVNMTAHTDERLFCDLLHGSLCEWRTGDEELQTAESQFSCLQIQPDFAFRIFFSEEFCLLCTSTDLFTHITAQFSGMVAELGFTGCV